MIQLPVKNRHLLAALMAVGSASAATVSHTDSFNVNETYPSTSGSTEVFSAGFLATTVDPFDSSLGTLESFTVTWSLTGSFTGISPGGGVSVAYSGDFLIQSLALPNDGTAPGGGNGNGGPPGAGVSFDFPSPGSPVSFTRTFNVADAGVLYDTAILDAITGGTGFSLEWNTPLVLTGDFSDVTVTAASTVELIYTYSPVPEPSAALLGGAALGLACLRRRR